MTIILTVFLPIEPKYDINSLSYFYCSPVQVSIGIFAFLCTTRRVRATTGAAHSPYVSAKTSFPELVIISDLSEFINIF